MIRLISIYLQRALRLVLGVSLMAFIAATPAMAKSDPAPEADEHAASDGPDEDDPDYIPPSSTNMPMLLLPVVIKGRMSHYVFISYRLVVNNELQVDAVNQKIAWIHDASMRKLYKEDFSNPENRDRPDIPKLKAMLKKVANEILHEQLVKDVFFYGFRSELEPPPDPRAETAPPKKAASSGH
jgi:flagellar basal body-associated protein FliL